MFNFSLKNLYDNKVDGYLFWLDLVKWISIFCITVGLLLIFLFYNYWLAIIGSTLLLITGCIFAFIAHFAKKKLIPLLSMGGTLIESSEEHLVNKAKEKVNTFLTK